MLGPEGSTGSGPKLEDERGAWSDDLDLVYPADSNLTIPGMSDKPESCGVYYPAEFCAHDGEPQFAPSRCGNRRCPTCWSRWTADSAERITVRLQAARHDEPQGLRKRLVHAVSSPPEGEVRTIQQFHRLKRDAYQKAKEAGIRGGVAIAHGWRVKPDYKFVWRNQVKDDWVGGLWSWVRDNEKVDWRRMVYWSPHVHIIGLATDVDDVSRHADDWVVRRLSTLENYRLTDHASYNAIIGTARYILSHAAYDPNDSKQAVRWFGVLAPAAFSPDDVSDGVLRTIKRMTEETLETGPDGPDDDAAAVDDELDDDDACRVCGGHDFRSIWLAGDALQDKQFCENIGITQQRRLRTAWEWAIGDIQPPPGAKRPGSEDAAIETFQTLLERRPSRY